MSDLTPVQRAVTRYHKEGFAVLPITPDSKSPAIATWEPYQRRRPTVAELRQWFSGAPRNIAIVCGAVSGGLAVLDIDNPRLADALADDVGLQAETTMVRTPRGGLHIYAVELDAVSRSGPLMPGIADLKGEGGYVLVPPSSVGGREYAVHTNSTIKCVPDARQWATGLLRAYGMEVAPETERKPLSIAETLEEMAPGNRNVSLFKTACKLRSMGLSDADIAAFVRQTGRDQGLPDREIKDILKSVARYPDGDSTTGELAGPVLVPLARVQREEVSWLWPGYIPRGRLTGIMGDPGAGKSWLTLAVAAVVTTGAPLPGQETRGEPGNVLLLTAEDGLADTVRPRLEDMGADLNRVTVLTAVRDNKGTERHPSLVNDIPALEMALAEGGYGLLIIDPINAYLGFALDTHRDAALRSVLSPLAALAERWRVAGVFVLHLTKGRRDRAIYRGQGSVAYNAAARVVHLVGQNPDNLTERALVPVKNNLLAMPPAVGFEITEGQFLWCGETTLTAAAILAPDDDAGAGGALAEAADFLREVLAEGSRQAKEVQREAEAVGISRRSLWAAKKALSVKVSREGEPGRRGGGTWFWVLPDGVKDATGDLGYQASHLIPLIDSVSGEAPDGLGVDTLNQDNGQQPDLPDTHAGEFCLACEDSKELAFAERTK